MDVLTNWKNAFPHYMPILFEENGLKSIWTRSLVRFHGVQSSKHFCCTDRIN
jgi:hypothetical protein